MFWGSRTLLFGGLLAHLPTTTSAQGRCETAQATFSCRKCDGIVEVADCFDECPGFISTDRDHGICYDRKLFGRRNTDPNDFDNHNHILWRDLVGAAVWFIIAGVATASGVGGGGIYVPLGILLFSFAPKQSSGLSQASIFGASLGGLILNLRNKHPQTNIRNVPGVEKNGRTLHEEFDDDESYTKKFYTRPLINYDLVLFLAPMVLAGAVLGVLIQRLLPNWLYLILACVILSITAYKTFGKFLASRAKEKEQENAAKIQEETENQTETPVDMTNNEEDEEDDIVREPGSPMENTFEVVRLVCRDNSQRIAKLERRLSTRGFSRRTLNVKGEEPPVDKHREQRRKYLDQDMRQFPGEKIRALFLLWIVLLVITLLKGGGGAASLAGITCESPWFSILTGGQFGWLFGFATFHGKKLLSTQEARTAVAYPFLVGDAVWNWKALRFYGMFTFVAGIVAGLIGIGGGMVLGPLMLVLGIHPRVSSATTATMVTLTSSSVAAIFIISEFIPWTYALFYFTVCLSGALLGKSKIDGYVKRSGRASLIVLILASVILLATIGTIASLLLNLSQSSWCLSGLRPFCAMTSQSESACLANRLLLQFTEL